MAGSCRQANAQEDERKRQEKLRSQPGEKGAAGSEAKARRSKPSTDREAGIKVRDRIASSGTTSVTPRHNDRPHKRERVEAGAGARGAVQRNDRLEGNEQGEREGSGSGLKSSVFIYSSPPF